MSNDNANRPVPDVGAIPATPDPEFHAVSLPIEHARALHGALTDALQEAVTKPADTHDGQHAILVMRTETAASILNMVAKGLLSPPMVTTKFHVRPGAHG